MIKHYDDFFAENTHVVYRFCILAETTHLFLRAFDIGTEHATNGSITPLNTPTDSSELPREVSATCSTESGGGSRRLVNAPRSFLKKRI